MIARLIERPAAVIATGGGAFIDAETRALILERCIAIWLDAESRRWPSGSGAATHRPLLAGKDPAPCSQRSPRSRNPIYAEAHLTVRSERAARTDGRAIIVGAGRAR